MDSKKIERIATWLMVGSALAGTIWYIMVELERKGDLSAVGWSVILVIWFIVYRRLLHQWRTRRSTAKAQPPSEEKF